MKGLPTSSIISGVLMIIADLWLIFIQDVYYGFMWMTILCAGITAIPFVSRRVRTGILASSIGVLHCLAILLIMEVYDHRTFYGGKMTPLIAVYLWGIISIIMLFVTLIRRAL